MENMSILTLFSAQPKVELPKQDSGTGQGEFENVFKKNIWTVLKNQLKQTLLNPRRKAFKRKNLRRLRKL